ncbi:MAG: glycosyltransferase [Candidatus Azobacteroides sp.]|nr:glycosyltransferase [Candidatus Azobacteroides sp.]
MMKILHIGTLSIAAGGPAMSTYNTVKGLLNKGEDISIFMYRNRKDDKLIANDIPIHYAGYALENKFAYSPTFKKNLKQLGTYDIIHTQGIWQYPTYAAIDVARKLNIPYLITPRGMLYPQDIYKSNKFFKLLSLKLRLLKDLNNAACVQATCTEEMEYCRKLGVKSPIAIIPNPIEIKKYEAKKEDGIFRLGYLGRLHPRKNVESLIYAFSMLKDKLTNAELIIIGGGDNEYEDFLKSEAERLDLKNIKFMGFLSGKEKEDALASLSLLVLPSEFENLGNVILEGLLREIPCIATKGAPWEDLIKHECGWWIDYTQEAITKAIEEAISTSSSRLRQMGENGKLLVRDKYSMEAISEKMVILYKWILNKGKKADFIFTL